MGEAAKVARLATNAELVVVTDMRHNDERERDGVGSSREQMRGEQASSILRKGQRRVRDDRGP